MAKRFEDTTRQAESKEPIRALRQLPEGPLFLLHELVRGSAPEHQLRVGRAQYSDIAIGDNDQVADTHCFLLWGGDRLEARDFASGKVTRFNGVSLVEGHVLLEPGDVLTVGTKAKVTRLVVCGEDLNQKPRIPVVDMPELVVESPKYHGKKRACARAIQVDKSTFNRKLKEFMPAATLCLCVVGGSLWLTSSVASRAVSQPLAMPAAGAVQSVIDATPTPAVPEDLHASTQEVPTLMPSVASPEPERTPVRSKPQPDALEQTKAKHKRRHKRRLSRSPTRSSQPTALPAEADESDGDREEIGATEDAKRPLKVIGGSYRIERKFRGASYAVRDGQLVPLSPAGQNGKERR